MPPRFRLSLPLLGLALAGSAPCFAGSAADGLPVGPASTDAQSRPAVVPDGHGGAIVSYKTATLRVGAVHVNSNGIADGGLAFAPVALPVTLEAGEPLRLSLPSDSQVVFVGDRGTDSSPALASIRAGGTASAGFPVTLGMAHRHPAVVAGLGGRTLIVSKNSDATSYWTLRVAILRADGGVDLAAMLPSPRYQFFNADRLDATSDGAGGLIAAFPYYDLSSSGSKDIGIFRLAADGSRPWGDLPLPAIVAMGDQVDPRLAPDGAGGVIMVWTDPRGSAMDPDIYAVRIQANARHARNWLYYGQAVCDAPGAQLEPRIVSDGGFGAWVIWLDERDGADGDLRFSHVRVDGSLAAGFTTSGAELCTAPGAQGEVDLAADDAGGFFAVWRDDRNGNADIFAQHVLPSGAISPGWPANGLALTTAPGAQDQPAIASVGGGRAVVAWRDGRDASTRIYGTGLVDASTSDAPPSVRTRLRLVPIGPLHGEASVRLTLPTGEPAVLELLDLSGRVRARTEPAGPLTDAPITLAPERSLEPGLYFARARQGSARARARVTVLR